MKTYKQARRQLGEQFLYYGMLHTKHQKFLKEIGRSNFFKPVIEELKQQILELDNENRRRNN